MFVVKGKHLFFCKSLSHSAAQNFHLVQVFLNSSLCLLHFANYVFNSESILFCSAVKGRFTFLLPLLCQRSKKNYCHSFWNKNTYATQLAPVFFFPKLCYIIEYYSSLQSFYIVFLVFAMKL